MAPLYPNTTGLTKLYVPEHQAGPPGTAYTSRHPSQPAGSSGHKSRTIYWANGPKFRRIGGPNRGLAPRRGPARWCGRRSPRPPTREWARCGLRTCPWPACTDSSGWWAGLPVESGRLLQHNFVDNTPRGGVGHGPAMQALKQRRKTPDSKNAVLFGNGAIPAAFAGSGAAHL